MTLSLSDPGTEKMEASESALLCVCTAPHLRGFAFVVFEDAEAVQRVMDEVPHTIDGRQVDAKKAIPHAIHQVSVILRVVIDC